MNRTYRSRLDVITCITKMIRKNTKLAYNFGITVYCLVDAFK